MAADANANYAHSPTASQMEIIRNYIEMLEARLAAATGQDPVTTATSSITTEGVQAMETRNVATTGTPAAVANVAVVSAATTTEPTTAAEASHGNDSEVEAPNGSIMRSLILPSPLFLRADGDSAPGFDNAGILVACRRCAIAIKDCRFEHTADGRGLKDSCYHCAAANERCDYPGKATRGRGIRRLSLLFIPLAILTLQQ
jgi:hypothetical protein